MELLLIRHALPVRREGTTGPADPALSPEGVAQAELLAGYLATERVDAIYSSPLRRALETAAPVAASQGLEVVVEDAVAEFDRLATGYIPIEEIKAAGGDAWQEFIANPWSADATDETLEEFNAVLVAAIERLIASHRGDRIAVVCHGGVINGYLGHVLGQPTTSGFFYPNYTSIHRVAAASSGQRTLVTLNETAHLRGSGLPIGLVQS